MSFAIDIHKHFEPVRDDPMDETAAAAAATALANMVRERAAHARPIGSLTLAELVPHSTFEQRAGMYVVFHKDAAVYVGTSRSQPYLVRVAAHLAAEREDYLNSLTKAYVREVLGLRVADATRADILKAATAVARDCSILFLTVPQRFDADADRKAFVRALLILEHDLQAALNTPWNNPGRRAKKAATALRLALAEEAESARIEHENLEVLADGEDDTAWQSAALDQLGVKEGLGLVVKVRSTWRADADGPTRQAAVVGDWPCSHAVAKTVRVVVGVANARVVEAWHVDGFDVVGDDRVRFRPAGKDPIDVTDVPMSEDILRARGHRYLRRES